MCGRIRPSQKAEKYYIIESDAFLFINNAMCNWPIKIKIFFLFKRYQQILINRIELNVAAALLRREALRAIILTNH